MVGLDHAGFFEEGRSADPFMGAVPSGGREGGREAIDTIFLYSDFLPIIHQSRNCKGRKITENFGYARNQSASRRSYRRDMSM